MEKRLYKEGQKLISLISTWGPANNEAPPKDYRHPQKNEVVTCDGYCNDAMAPENNKYIFLKEYPEIGPDNRRNSFNLSHSRNNP